MGAAASAVPGSFIVPLPSIFSKILNKPAEAPKSANPGKALPVSANKKHKKMSDEDLLDQAMTFAPKEMTAEAKKKNHRRNPPRRNPPRRNPPRRKPRRRFARQRRKEMSKHQDTARMPRMKKATKKRQQRRQIQHLMSPCITCRSIQPKVILTATSM